MSDDGEMVSALATENERLSVELAQWKAAAGWTGDGFGPQTPDEVAVFRREAERVDGQVAGLEIAKLRAEVERLKSDLEFETDCKNASHNTGKVMWEQRNEARTELEAAKEQYKLEKQTHAVYKDSAEDCIRAMQTERDEIQLLLKACDGCFYECQGLARHSIAESDHYWELAEALMELTSKRLGIPIERGPADPDDANPGV